MRILRKFWLILHVRQIIVDPGKYGHAWNPFPGSRNSQNRVDDVTSGPPIPLSTRHLPHRSRSRGHEHASTQARTHAHTRTRTPPPHIRHILRKPAAPAASRTLRGVLVWGVEWDKNINCERQMFSGNVSCFRAMSHVIGPYVFGQCLMFSSNVSCHRVMSHVFGLYMFSGDVSCFRAISHVIGPYVFGQ
jgi:hypothetical protein